MIRVQLKTGEYEFDADDWRLESPWVNLLRNGVVVATLAEHMVVYIEDTND